MALCVFIAFDIDSLLLFAGLIPNGTAGLACRLAAACAFSAAGYAGLSYGLRYYFDMFHMCLQVLLDNYTKALRNNQVLFLKLFRLTVRIPLNPPATMPKTKSNIFIFSKDNSRLIKAKIKKENTV